VEGIGDFVPVRIDDRGRTTANQWTDGAGPHVSGTSDESGEKREKIISIPCTCKAAIEVGEWCIPISPNKYLLQNNMRWSQEAWSPHGGIHRASSQPLHRRRYLHEATRKRGGGRSLGSQVDAREVLGGTKSC
jgi:hypothetical protein